MRVFLAFCGSGGNDRRSLLRFLGFLLLIGLICVVVGVGTSVAGAGASADIPLVAGLMIIFFMTPIIFLRQMLLIYIRDHVGKDRTDRK